MENEAGLFVCGKIKTEGFKVNLKREIGARNKNKSVITSKSPIY